MNLLSESTKFVPMLLLALPCLLLLAAYLCKRLLCQVGAKPEVKLAPAELAFLAREGDMTHTMVVLGFDLFHRALKRGESESVVLLPYEQRLWQKTKDFLRDKTKDQVNKLTPISKSLSGSYRLLTGKARQIIQQIVSDPRNLRAYFSPYALGRFVTDVLSSGYKDLISTEIVALLTARGYLISQKKQEELSSWLLIIAALGFAILINIAWLLVLDVRALVLIVAMAAINAVLFKLVFSILTIMPLYEEVSLVLKHVSLKNLAVKICRSISLAIRTLLVVLMVLLILLFLSIDLLILMLFNYHASVGLLVDVILLTLNCFVLLTILLNGFRLKLSPKLSSAGVEIVLRQRKDLSDKNIIESFKLILTNNSYDPTVSELLAVYGYETLWLLT